MIRFAVAFLAFIPLGGMLCAQDSEDAKALKESVARFQDAYNAHDVEALTASWSEDVDLVSAAGTLYEGREAIAELYRNLFEQAPEIAIASEVFRVRVLGDAAVVDGSVSVSSAPEAPAEASRFTAVFSRTGDDKGWQVVSMREATLPAVPAFEKLEPLAWLVGDWVDSDESRKVFTTIEWSPDGDELCRTSLASTEEGGRRLVESRIFWNPKTERIESRTRDEDRLVHGVWSQEGDDWVVSTTELDEEGNKATARIRMSPKGENEMTVQAVEGEGAGENAKSSPAVSVKRVP